MQASSLLQRHSWNGALNDSATWDTLILDTGIIFISKRLGFFVLFCPPSTQLELALVWLSEQVLYVPGWISSLHFIRSNASRQRWDIMCYGFHIRFVVLDRSDPSSRLDLLDVIHGTTSILISVLLQASLGRYGGQRQGDDEEHLICYSHCLTASQRLEGVRGGRNSWLEGLACGKPGAREDP